MKIPWSAVTPIDPVRFAQIRQRTIFECCKWDPQVEDVSTLSTFPLILDRSEWETLCALTRQLAAETLAAEIEMAQRPELHSRLGLPRAIQNVLADVPASAMSRECARVMRFDFHFTTEGWRITEVNSDVPGGFVEASGFTSIMADEYAGTTFISPADRIADAFSKVVPNCGVVAFVHATAFTDDRQVMVFLGRKLEALGMKVLLCGPDHVCWSSGNARIESRWYKGPVDAVFRFFPAEWLPNLPRKCDWLNFFHGSRTPLCNPATALLTQSKRFPLLWNYLGTQLPTWRELLPETYDLRHVDYRNDTDWVLKPALGRVGDGIRLRNATTEKDLKTIYKSVRREPDQWVAQRRFEPIACDTKGDPVFPCIGMYTVDGSIAGAYGRISSNGLVDYRAQDIAVLINKPVELQKLVA